MQEFSFFRPFPHLKSVDEFPDIYSEYCGIPNNFLHFLNLQRGSFVSDKFNWSACH